MTTSSSYTLSNSTFAHPLDPIGYWGPPTSSERSCTNSIMNVFIRLPSPGRTLTLVRFPGSLHTLIIVDWCESNYDISFYVAEFFNSLSSVSMIVVGLLGVYLHSSFEKRFLLTFGSIAVVGLGSIAFHGTLLFPLQMLDEVPMVYSILSLAYCCIEDRPYRRHGTWFPVSIALYGVLTTLVMMFAGPENHLLEFVVFQSSFTFMVLVVMSHIVKIYGSIQDMAIRKMWQTCGGLALGAYLLWNIDFRLCHVVQNMPLGLWNPQLHAIWHVGASMSSYLVTFLICYHRAENLGRQPSIAWKWNVLPYVVVEHEKSK